MIGALIVPSQNDEKPGEDGSNYAFGFLVLIQVSAPAMPAVGKNPGFRLRKKYFFLHFCVFK